MKPFAISPTLSRFGRALRGLALASLLLPLGAAAQTAAGPGSVRGSLVEDGTGQPVPFSDVLLLRAADSTFVAVAQTSEQGTFQANSLPLGTYLMRVQDLNYQPLRRRFSLTEAVPTMQFPALKMSAATATKLSEVVVTGEKATVVEELGKRVINVEKDLGSVGGTAANVLQNVPSVSVDVNGTVSMRGSTNLTILIDGKPAAAGNGGAGGPRLDQIPASRIAQVEVITNPSAKYDASGGGGVINLITKKEVKNGTNGTAAFTVGTRDKYTGNLNLTRKVGKATWSASYNGRDVTYGSRSRSEQTARLGTGESTQNVRTTQVGAGNEIHRNHSVEVGVQLELPKDQNLSLTVSPSAERNLEGEGQNLTQQNDNGPVQRVRGRQDLDVKVKILEYGGDYRRTWAAHKGRELTANLGGVKIDATVPVVQRQFVEPGSAQVPQPGAQQQLGVLADIQFGKVDYTHPFRRRQRPLGSGRETRAPGQPRLQQIRVRQRKPSQRIPGRPRPLAYLYVGAAGTRGLRNGAAALGAKWSTQLGLRSEYTHLSGTVDGGVGIAQRGKPQPRLPQPSSLRPTSAASLARSPAKTACS
jgi:hypothetical protein